jgi:hypothetical protein
VWKTSAVNAAATIVRPSGGSVGGPRRCDQRSRPNMSWNASISTAL